MDDEDDVQLEILKDDEKDDYVPDQKNASFFDWVEVQDHPEDNMALHYRHVRHGLSSVAIELASVCHMSRSQIESAYV